MQDNMPENRPPEQRDPNLVRPGMAGDPNLVRPGTAGVGTGGWAVAVIIAVLVAVGAIYYATSGPSTGGVDPNANTSSIDTTETAPSGGVVNEPAGGIQQPTESQPSTGQ